MNGESARWGTDLRLLHDLEFQYDRNRGRDLELRTREETNQVDLELLQGVDNLKQALLLRFLTMRGELTVIGHPTYGSRLFDLIGEPNTETNRNRAKLYVLEALQAEPRVKEIISVEVSPVNKVQIRIEVALRALDSNNVLNLVFPFFLEGESN